MLSGRKATAKLGALPVLGGSGAWRPSGSVGEELPQGIHDPLQAPELCLPSSGKPSFSN